MASLPFAFLDYAIISIVLILPVIIGLYYRFSGGKQKTMQEYLLADRGMSIIPVSISIMTSAVSSISFLGYVSEFYSSGSIYLSIVIATIVGTACNVYFYLPVFYKLQRISLFEYLELRFGPRLRLVASVMFSLKYLLYSAVILYIPAMVIHAVTGLNKNLFTVLMGVACSFYTAIGGMKAVVMTDVFQMVLMYGSILSVVIYGTINLGGIGNVIDLAVEHGRLNFDNFSVDPTVRLSFWNISIGAGALCAASYSINQPFIQRLMTVNDLRKSKICMWLGTFLTVLVVLLLWIVGLILIAHFKDCDPVKSGAVNAYDHVLPYYVTTVMTRIGGLLGLFVAGVICATLSSISGICNSIAALTLRDYMPHIEKRFTGLKLKGPLVSKCVALAYGLLITILALFADRLEGVMQSSFIVTGSFGGALLGIFTLGMFTTTVHETAALIGLLTAMPFLFWINLGGPRPPKIALPMSVEGCINSTISLATQAALPMIDNSEYFYLYRISFMWMTLISMGLVMAVAYPLSFVIRCTLPWQRENKISDGAGHSFSGMPDPDLFVFFISKKVRQSNNDTLNKYKNKDENIPLTHRSANVSL